MFFRAEAMFCPKCGSNQGEGKRFCTVCGTNLAAVSQALTGQFPPPNYYAPPVPHPFEFERRKTMANGVRLSIIGGGLFAWQFLNFVFSGFHNTPSKFWTFIGFILLAVGISKIIASRPPSAVDSPSPAPHQSHSTRVMRETDSHPVLFAPPAAGSSIPQTSELEPAGRRIPSVTPSVIPSVIEDETRHLPHGEPTRDLMK
jgi:hypothetical protein